MITTSGRVVRKTTGGGTKAAPVRQTAIEQFEEALQLRDFAKATTMLEFYKSSGMSLDNLPLNPWLAYSAFHMNDIGKAIEVYKEMLAQSNSDPLLYVNLGCCYFVQGDYAEAEECALRGPACSLQTRLLFHIAQQTHDEDKLIMYHKKLQDTVEDKLSLAAAQYSRNQFQEAIDIYKRILMQTREYLALNVYVAMCYYKLEYYEISLEILNSYLQTYNNSAIAINLKACNHYRLFNGQAAETELKVLIDLHRTTYNVETDIVRHNLVVFRNGEDALQVLPNLLDVGIPEARLNLVIYYLRHDQISEAYELIKDVEPLTSQEYILKAVINAFVGQQLSSQDHLRICKEYFQYVGNAQTECDTIPGRQCMASYYFLMRNFNNVLIYLRSIKPFFPKDDTFLYLYGIACAGVGRYDEAEESLMAVRSEKIRSEFSYISWLVRSHIMNKHAKKAWDIYLKMGTTESLMILQLIADDCYKTSEFYYAAKAFDVLLQLNYDEKYVKGKRGACIGVFQQIFANERSPDLLPDIIDMLKPSAEKQIADSEAAEEFAQIARTIENWAKSAKVRRR